MPRPPRVHLPGALYYVTSRAMEGIPLFRDAQDYETYLTLLRGYQERFGFKLFAYVLLPTEVHICLELTNEATISTIMHALNSRYTKHVGKRDSHEGHVFQERFKLTLMEKAPNLLRVSALIHRLPQQRTCVRGARLYAWSSYAGYLTTTHNLEQEEVLGRLSSEAPGMTYATYVQGLAEEELTQWEAQWQRHVIGSAAFLAQVEQNAHTQSHTMSARRFTERAMPISYNAMAGGSGPMPVPTPRPSGPRPRVSVALTASLSVAFLSLSAAGLYARNTAVLRTTLRTVTQERTLASLSPAATSTMGASMTPALASMTPPSALAGTVWALQVKPMYAAGSGGVVVDELRFESGKVVSSTLAAQGFAGSNYSLTIQGNGVVLWETMQTGPNNEVVCWRGEWDGKTMHGVMTRQLPGQVVTNFAFIGTSGQGTVSSHSTRET